MKALWYCMAMCMAIIGYAQKEKVEVLQEQNGDTILLVIRNTSLQIQSIQIDGQLQGLIADKKLPVTTVVPPISKQIAIKLAPLKSMTSYGLKYQYTYVAGDVSAKHDSSHVYDLPYRPGTSYLVGQGYLERPTHMGEYALDFNMDVGAEICAIRSGIVFEVVDHHNRGCPQEKCSDFNNYILVQHSDGSIADYSHLQKNGALVQVGDSVKAGQVIARSGATGWASGPHLHLKVYVPRFSGQESVPAIYRLSDSKKGIPHSGNHYPLTSNR